MTKHGADRKPRWRLKKTCLGSSIILMTWYKSRSHPNHVVQMQAAHWSKLDRTISRSVDTGDTEFVSPLVCSPIVYYYCCTIIIVYYMGQATERYNKQDVQGHWRPAVLVNVRVPQATVKTWLQHLRYNNNIYSIRWSINLPGPGHHISFITANNSVNKANA